MILSVAHVLSFQLPRLQPHVPLTKNQGPVQNPHTNPNRQRGCLKLKLAIHGPFLFSGLMGKVAPRAFHGCWEAFHIFAWCGLVVEIQPRISAKIGKCLLPFQRQPRFWKVTNLGSQPSGSLAFSTFRVESRRGVFFRGGVLVPSHPLRFLGFLVVVSPKFADPASPGI